VRRELILVASRKRRHLDRLRIRLVVKEHVEIPVFDTPETHRGYRVVNPGHVQSLLASVLASTVSARAALETDYRQASTTSTVPTISPTTDTMVPATS
jgi:hypothetical protein